MGIPLTSITYEIVFRDSFSTIINKVLFNLITDNKKV